MNYDNSITTGAAAGVVAGLLVVYVIFILAMAIFGIVVMWKIFQKAGKEGWIALIPFYNLYTLFEITWGNGWLFLLIFLSIIPVIGGIAVLVIIILTNIKLANAFGKSGGFAVGLIFLGIIFMAILAFDKSEYIGVDGKTTSAPNTASNNDYVSPQPTTPVEPTTSIEQQSNDTNNE